MGGIQGMEEELAGGRRHDLMIVTCNVLPLAN